MAEHEQMWDVFMTGAEELAAELGLEEPPAVFTPTRALPAVDAWLTQHVDPLDKEDTARLAGLLARVLVEAHGGGLTKIAERGHPLDGEWALTMFGKALARDYHVPIVVSAVRIGIDREVGAVEWYKRLLKEGR